jgi:hypothetical protein
MAEPFCRTAEASNHTVRPFCHTAGSASRTAGTFCPTADVSDRTVGRANRTRKPFYRAAEPFYRTEKSSSRTVFRQKHAKTGKNHPFSPSRPANWSKSNSLRRSAPVPGRSNAIFANALENSLPPVYSALLRPGTDALRFAYFAVQTSTKNKT